MDIIKNQTTELVHQVIVDLKKKGEVDRQLLINKLIATLKLISKL